ncbi:hypothetical protein SLA2020_408900 [Shorea laevis]
MLPEDCLSEILSLTSPEDAFRSSLVSTSFRSATESDLVWERFLPSDYREIISRLINPLKFSSKKELFLSLCCPVLIDAGTKSFKLEKSSGKKSYILSASELSITWGSDPIRWGWISSTASSRFSKVAVLRTTEWLEIRGKIRMRMLTPNTTYEAYLIMKISNWAYGLDSRPLEMSIEVRGQVFSRKAFLQKHDGMEKEEIEGDWGVLRGREDGWMEIRLGGFFNGEDDEEATMSLREVKGCQLKGGLVIEGIEVRPKQLGLANFVS